MKWGQITWIFLHTLSMKIQPEQYLSLRNSVFMILITICTALPCPECSEHAIMFMRNKKPPETVEQFRLFIWDFHNIVNIHTKKPRVPSDVLLKYNNTDLQTAFNILQHVWLHQPYNPNLIPKQMLIQHTIQQTRAWLVENKFIST